MNLEEYAGEVLRKGDAAALERIARSEAGARLASCFDGRAMEAAARDGNMDALSAMLRDILKTPEGQSFAAEVQKAVKRDER